MLIVFLYFMIGAVYYGMTAFHGDRRPQTIYEHFVWFLVNAFFWLPLTIYFLITKFTTGNYPVLRP